MPDIRTDSLTVTTPPAKTAENRVFYPLRARTEPRTFTLPKAVAPEPIRKGGIASLPIARNVFSLRGETDTGAPELDAKKAAMTKAAQGFEAIFVRQFLKSMETGIGGGGLYGGGASGEIYGDIVENALAESIAKQGKFGIAGMVKTQLSRRLEPGATSAPAVLPAQGTKSPGDDEP
jgi:peptidoglycan hydrolase FlgJ